MTPCRLMPTRRCPDVFTEGCAEGACARFESDDEAPWLEQLELEAKGQALPYVRFEDLPMSGESSEGRASDLG